MTGASSFTGYWFARFLAHAGHDLVVTFRSAKEQYAGVRARRVRELASMVDCRWGVEFGDAEFLRVVEGEAFDLFCHHGAEMTNYRSWDFDPLSATRSNTREIRRVLAGLVKHGCDRVVLTGSVFEPFEGIGDAENRAFNPYGLSKHLSFEICRMEASRLSQQVGKFVIPNPFGPYEDGRFTTYLTQSWLRGEAPLCRTPRYIRDNIHVSQLASAYLDYCTSPNDCDLPSRCSPSGYVESQREFALRVATEFSARTEVSAHVTFAEQAAFEEPPVKVNPPRAYYPESWPSETAAWDEAVEYWQAQYDGKFR
jgi:UDP-glucose 4-epimerase